MFLGSKFRTIFQKPKKIEKVVQQGRIIPHLGRPCGMRGLLGREKERGQKPLEIGDIGRSLEKADFGKNLKHVFDTPCSPSVGGGALRAIRRAVSRWPVKLAKYYPSEHHVRPF